MSQIITTNAALSSQSTTVRNRFDRWALNGSASYDRLCISQEYSAPTTLAQLIRGFLKGNVLDAGCGTGKLGRLIFEGNDIKSLDGLDLSTEMLKICVQHGIYDRLMCADLTSIEQILPELRKKEYDAIVSCGTYGDYVDPHHLHTLLRIMPNVRQVCIAGETRKPIRGLRVDTRAIIEEVLENNGFQKILDMEVIGYIDKGLGHSYLYRQVPFTFIVGRKNLD